MILRGVIQAVRINGNDQVFLDVTSFANSVHKNVPLFSQFGVASIPKVGTRCILAALGNDMEALIAISTQTATKDGDPRVLVNESTVQIHGNGEEIVQLLIDFATAIEGLKALATGSPAQNAAAIASAVGELKALGSALSQGLARFRGN